MSSDDEPLRWRNHYKCPRCKTQWEDEWSCQCDDRCPKCNLSCSPYESDDLLKDPPEPIEVGAADLASSGVVDVRPAGSGGQGTAGVSIADYSSSDEGTIEHGAWQCVEELDLDSDGFSTPGWFAVNKITGESRIIQHSRFDFYMTEARFRWLAENNFPASPGRGPWTNAAIDAAMEDGA